MVHVKVEETQDRLISSCRWLLYVPEKALFFYFLFVCLSDVANVGFTIFSNLKTVCLSNDTIETLFVRRRGRACLYRWMMDSVRLKSEAKMSQSPPSGWLHYSS